MICTTEGMHGSQAQIVNYTKQIHNKEPKVLKSFGTSELDRNLVEYKLVL